MDALPSAGETVRQTEDSPFLLCLHERNAYDVLFTHSDVARMARALGDYDVFKADALTTSPVFEIASFFVDLGKEMGGVSVIDRYVVFLCKGEESDAELVELVNVHSFHPTLLRLRTRHGRPESHSCVSGAAQEIDQRRRDRLFHVIHITFNPTSRQRAPPPSRDQIVVLVPRAIMEVAARVLKTTVRAAASQPERVRERKEYNHLSLSLLLRRKRQTPRSLSWITWKNTAGPSTLHGRPLTHGEQNV